MGFTDAVKHCLQNYVTFSGRASRSEFWYFMLFAFLLAIVLQILGSIIHPLAFFSLIQALTLFLPQLSVIVRRLHDIDKSGWWYWIALIPLVGIILLIVWQCTRGTEGENRFGSDPLG